MNEEKKEIVSLKDLVPFKNMERMKSMGSLFIICGIKAKIVQSL